VHPFELNQRLLRAEERLPWLIPHCVTSRHGVPFHLDESRNSVVCDEYLSRFRVYGHGVWVFTGGEGANRPVVPPSMAVRLLPCTFAT